MVPTLTPVMRSMWKLSKLKNRHQICRFQSPICLATKAHQRRPAIRLAPRVQVQIRSHQLELITKWVAYTSPINYSLSWPHFDPSKLRHRADRPSISVKSVANVSNISECWTVIAEITRHTRNTSAPIVTRDSTIHLIWNDMFALTRVWYLHLFINRQNRRWYTREQFNYFDLGVKPYKCDYCEKSFTQRCSLESHQDKIHGVKCTMPYKKRREKIYVCEECGFSTGDVREHYKHAREAHSCTHSCTTHEHPAQVKEESQHGCC